MNASAETLESRWLGAEDRIPESLAELRGPTGGLVKLPNRLAWSGLTEFDVREPEDRLHLYQILIDVGQRDDVAQYMDATLLRQDWSVLRRLLPWRLRSLWEARLPLAPVV